MSDSFDEAYWDRVWHSERAPSMSSGPPNPHLVQEIGGLAPGTALEAGCGGGAEAIWLAQRGWEVTAADVSDAALALAAERAAAEGGADHVQWVAADLSVWEPGTTYDLVTTHYAHPAMPQLEFYDRLASWVRPGGTLFIVGHLGHHGPADQGHGHAHDGPPEAAEVTADAITARLDARAWRVETARGAHRTTGADDHATSLHDVVVRAARLS